MRTKNYTEFGTALDRDGEMDLSKNIGEILCKLHARKQLNLPANTKIKVMESRISYAKGEDLPERFGVPVITTLGRLKRNYKKLIGKPFNPETFEIDTAPTMAALKGIGF